METQTLKISPYQSTHAKDLPCGLISGGESKDGAAVRYTGADLNKLVVGSPYKLFLFSEQEELPRELAEKGFKVLAISRQVKIVCFQRSPAHLMFSAEAWQKLHGFGDELSNEAVVTDFLEKGKLLRAFSTMVFTLPFRELLSRPAEKASAVSAPPTEEEVVTRDIDVGGIVLRSSPNLAANVPIVTKMDDSTLAPKIQQAIECINQNRDAEALPLLKEITSKRTDIIELFYIQAIAEVRLQLLGDAARSLLILLQNVPDHQLGKQLLAEVRTHL